MTSEIPDGYVLPLVDKTTKKLPQPTVDAIPSQIADGSIAQSKLDDSTKEVLGSVAGIQSTADAAVPATDLDAATAALVPDAGTATGAALSATIVAAGPSLRLEQFGAVDTTGSADCSTVYLAALAQAQAVGGTVVFPAGIIRINAQLIFAQTSGAQKSVRLTGQGAVTAWDAAGGKGGTVLDLRYSSTGAKIETYGRGVLEIDHLTLTDLGTSTTPFVLTTGTKLLAHDMSIIGNPAKSLDTCDQDGFILGGLNGTTLDNSRDEAFQGYGTAIERVAFDRIRTGVRVQNYGNSIIIAENSWSARCGNSGLEGAIEINPGTAVVSGQTAFAYGTVLRNNLIEVLGYKYGIRLMNKCAQNVLVGNSFWDALSTDDYLADIFFDANAGSNVVADPGVQTKGKYMVDTSGLNFWIGPSFEATGGYQMRINGGTAGTNFVGPVKTQKSLTVVDSSGNLLSQLATSGVRLKSGNSIRGIDSTGADRPMLSINSSDIITIGDAAAGMTGKSVILLGGPGSTMRLRINTADMILASATGVGFNGKAPVAKATNPGTATGTDAAVINAIVTALQNVGLIAT